MCVYIAASISMFLNGFDSIVVHVTAGKARAIGAWKALLIYGINAWRALMEVSALIPK